MRKVAEILNTTELFLTGDSDIEPGAFTEPSTEYSGALPFERMTDLELDFIYESRQRQLNETNDPQLRRELLGVIADVASELQKRIPSELEAEATRRAISAGDNREVKPEEKKK